MAQKDEPAIGVPYYVGQNPYQAGAIPPNAIFGDPKGIPLQQTMYRDTPAPFNCVYCGNSGVTVVRSKPSLAAVIGCMMPMMLGFCFLCPSMDCLWHKYHYCPSCKEKVADFEKSDPCAVMDPPHWTQESFALPETLLQSENSAPGKCLDNLFNARISNPWVKILVRYISA